MEAMRETARSNAAAIKQELSRLTWEKDGLEIDLGRLTGEIRREENDRSPTGHYVSLAVKKSRGWLALLAVLYLVIEVVTARRRLGRDHPTD
jgi:hypothetical protein